MIHSLGVYPKQPLDGTITKASLGGEKTGRNPINRGKLGVKRSVLTDGNGVPLIDGANRHDSKLVHETLASVPIGHPNVRKYDPQRLCVDGGYIGSEVAKTVESFHDKLSLRRRNDEANALKTQTLKKARRWVVGCAHSWMNRFRRVLIRWEKKAENYLAILQLTCALITFCSVE